MRRFLTRRWLGLHTLMVVLVTTFLALGWWQLRRGEQGNLRSFAYAIEWPIFAAFVIYMWIKEIRIELRPPQEADSPEDADAGLDLPGPRRAAPAPPPPVAEEAEEDDELAAYNRYLARLHTHASRQERE